MSSAKIRKYFDIGPASIATTNVYTGGITGWAAGIADISTSGNSNFWITSLAQSDDDQGRVGQSINIETLDVRVKIVPDNTAGGHGHLRMMILADEECDGTAPGFTEILGVTATTVATGLAMSFLNPGYFGRFKIIEDKNWMWSNLSAGAYQAQEADRFYWHESHHDLKGHRVMWDATNASAIANARKGHLFIAFLFENHTVTAAGGILTQTTANPPGVQWTTRIRYVDT